MKDAFSFRRGGLSPQSNHGAVDPGFVQVPTLFTAGLTPEQWEALQQTYRTAWENARRAVDEAGGDLNYHI
ncbi:MAG: hypothetical protein IAE82_08490 [Opitutaceae bacterium]|nr:hypothetical protein [Opitutaceae bacterium]